MNVLLIGPIGPKAKLKTSTRVASLHAFDPWNDADLVFTVDRGIETARMLGLDPGIWIGDGDSAPAFRKDFMPRQKIVLPESKDVSDLGAAMRLVFSEAPDAASYGPRPPQGAEILALGFLGGRFDHEMAVMTEFALLSAARPDLKITLLGNDCLSAGPKALRGEIRAAVSSKRRFLFEVGRVFSVLPAFGPAEEVTITGAHYALDNEVLDPGSQGLSNIATRSGVDVRVTDGTLWVIAPENLESSPESKSKSLNESLKKPSRPSRLKR